jgi:hypothetical protein
MKNDHLENLAESIQEAGEIKSPEIKNFGEKLKVSQIEFAMMIGVSVREDIVLEDNIFDPFMSACKKAEEPDKALIEAAKFTKEKGF